MFVYLGLGANLGDRLANLQAACTTLGDTDTITARSAHYESAPMYHTEQPRFLNMVIAYETPLAPHTLLTTLKAIEIAQGRDLGGFRNGPRPIDLDILLAYPSASQQTPADAISIDEPDLIIPHPRITERAFVLFPLRDIAPDLVHPTTGKTIAEIAASFINDDVTLIADETMKGQP